jgi:hypothetical protein
LALPKPGTDHFNPARTRPYHRIAGSRVNATVIPPDTNGSVGFLASAFVRFRAAKTTAIPLVASLIAEDLPRPLR